MDIWVWDVAGRTWTRVTSDPNFDSEPVWTPDSQRLIFASLRSGEISLYWQAANGTGIPERLIELSRQNSALPAISPDGKHVVLRETELGSSYIAIVDLGSARQALPIRAGESKPLVKTEFEEINAEISPDGRWLAYQSNRSGTFEVYVQPFPDVANGLWPVSRTGGTEPVWARDGRELFYRAPNGAVMRVSIAPGATWKASAPTQLFAATSYTARFSHGRNAPHVRCISRRPAIPDDEEFRRADPDVNGATYHRRAELGRRAEAARAAAKLRN